MVPLVGAGVAENYAGVEVWRYSVWGRIWWVCSASGSVLSVLMGSDASGGSCGRGGAMAGGDEFSGSVVGLVRA